MVQDAGILETLFSIAYYDDSGWSIRYPALLDQRTRYGDDLNKGILS